MHFTGIDKEEGCDIRPPGERVEDVPGRTVPESCGAMPRKGIELERDVIGIGLLALFKEKPKRRATWGR